MRATSGLQISTAAGVVDYPARRNVKFDIAVTIPRCHEWNELNELAGNDRSRSSTLFTPGSSGNEAQTVTVTHLAGSAQIIFVAYRSGTICFRMATEKNDSGEPFFWIRNQT